MAISKGAEFCLSRVGVNVTLLHSKLIDLAKPLLTTKTLIRELEEWVKILQELFDFLKLSLQMQQEKYQGLAQIKDWYYCRPR